MAQLYVLWISYVDTVYYAVFCMNSAIGLFNSFPRKKQVKILLLVTIYISSCKPFSKIESETFHLIWYLISYLHTS